MKKSPESTVSTIKSSSQPTTSVELLTSSLPSEVVAVFLELLDRLEDLSTSERHDCIRRVRETLALLKEDYGQIGAFPLDELLRWRLQKKYASDDWIVRRSLASYSESKVTK